MVQKSDLSAVEWNIQVGLQVLFKKEKKTYGMWINYIKELDSTGHSFMNRFGVAFKRG